MRKLENLLFTGQEKPLTEQFKQCNKERELAFLTFDAVLF